MKDIITTQWNEFVSKISDITHDFSTWGIITEVVDILLSTALIVIVLRALKIKLKAKRLVTVVLIAIGIYAVALVFNFNIILFIYKYVLFWILGAIIIIYNQEIRHIFDKSLHENVNTRNFSTEEEKQKLIDVLVKSSVSLSERQVGALITIECKDSLDSYIEKSINLNCDVSQEILSTIFYVGTPTHDGAVIIRKNSIMCAGAFYPSTDRYDIPKNLGTRHRAAIGISEKCDAITIVVSEETGNISVTVGGRIEIAITAEKLRELLEQHIIVK